MNFPLFHQVIVAGGLDPELRHSRKAIRETEKGSSGSDMVTLTGKTEKQNGTHKKSDSKNMSGESLFAGKYQRNYLFFIFFLLIAFFLMMWSFLERWYFLGESWYLSEWNKKPVPDRFGEPFSKFRFMKIKTEQLFRIMIARQQSSNVFFRKHTNFSISKSCFNSKFFSILAYF